MTDKILISHEEKGLLSLAKRSAIKKLAQLQGESEWNLLQQIGQEIEAHHIIIKEKLSLDKHLAAILEEAKSRYSEEPDLLALVLDAIPSRITLRAWKKKKGWEECVWMKIRGEGLFTTDRRAQVVGKLFEQAAIDGNVQAAKIWLTLSGDYSEKDPSAKNEALDVFRELNEAIHNKNK